MVNAPAFTVIEGLVSAVFETSLVFVAVIVEDPAVGRVTVANVTVPEESAAGAGIVAFASVVVSVIVFAGALAITFQ